MPVDLKSELTRPIALILMALAVLGWVLFVLSSWSSASVQKTQRLRIVELGEKTETLSADLARQVQASAALGDLQARMTATREDLARLTQTRNDAQAELVNAQQRLAGARRDLNDADRTLQSQKQKLADMENPAETAAAGSEAEPTVKSSRRGGRRSYRRGRKRAYYSRR